MIKRQKIEAMMVKCCKNREGISLINRKKKNCEKENGDNIDLDQANDKYS